MQQAELNPEQRLAVETTEGAVCVIAGPGAGKTRTLTSRYVYLVRDLGINPQNILCVTFTNKAAQEMKARIRAMTGDLDLGQICTFHAFCVRFLKDEGYVIGIPKDFIVIDEEDELELLNEVYETFGIPGNLMKFSAAMDVIGNFKDDSNYIRDLVLTSPESLREKALQSPDISDKVFYGYLWAERKIFGLDFDDVIWAAFYILDHFPSVKQKWQERLQYVMVDEYQDVSNDQAALANILSELNGNLFVVGDPDQTIYTWRGSSPAIMLRFPKSHKNCRTIKLMQNYRSLPAIIGAANSLIRHNRDRFPVEGVPIRRDADPANPSLVVFDGEKTEKESLAWFVKALLHLHKADRGWEEFAVLYRSRQSSRAVEEALVRAGIPYRVWSGVAFYARREVKDSLCYMRMLTRGDDAAFLRTVNSPKRGFGPKKADALKVLAMREGISYYEALKRHIDEKPFNTKAIREYVAVIEKARASAAARKVSDVFNLIMADSGYEASLQLSGEDERLNNLAELRQAIANYESDADDPTSLPEFLQRASVFAEDIGEQKGPAMKLMTIHAAKGLEFPVVFLWGFSEGIMPSSRTSTVEEMEEERRCCYVGMTRAKDLLILCHSQGTSEASTFRYPSRFFFELDRNLVKLVRPLEPGLEESAKEALMYKDKFLTGEPLESSSWRPGDRVRHKVFGDGEIITVAKSGAMTIRFPTLATPRTLMAGAPLERISTAGAPTVADSSFSGAPVPEPAAEPVVKDQK